MPIGRRGGNATNLAGDVFTHERHGQLEARARHVRILLEGGSAILCAQEAERYAIDLVRRQTDTKPIQAKQCENMRSVRLMDSHDVHVEKNNLKK